MTPSAPAPWVDLPTAQTAVGGDPAASVASVLTLAFVAASVFFSLVALVGFARLPDLFARIHAASKSETLGALCGLTAAGLAFGTGAELLKIGMLALFVLATGPTAAHAIGRAAALSGSADSPWNAGSPADAGRGDADADGTAGRVDP